MENNMRKMHANVKLKDRHDKLLDGSGFSIDRSELTYCVELITVSRIKIFYSHNNVPIQIARLYKHN